MIVCYYVIFTMEYTAWVIIVYPKTEINKNNNNEIIETLMVKTDVFVTTKEKFYKIYFSANL